MAALVQLLVARWIPERLSFRRSGAFDPLFDACRGEGLGGGAVLAPAGQLASEGQQVGGIKGRRGALELERGWRLFGSAEGIDF